MLKTLTNSSPELSNALETPNIHTHIPHSAILNTRLKTVLNTHLTRPAAPNATSSYTPRITRDEEFEQASNRPTTLKFQLTDETITLNQNLKDLLKKHSPVMRSMLEFPQSPPIPIPFNKETFDLFVTHVERLDPHTLTDPKIPFTNLKGPQLSELFKILDFFDVNQNINKQIATYVLRNNLIEQFVNQNPENYYILADIISKTTRFNILEKYTGHFNAVTPDNNKIIITANSYFGIRITIIELNNIHKAPVFFDVNHAVDNTSFTPDSRYLINKYHNKIIIIDLKNLNLTYPITIETDFDTQNDNNLCKIKFTSDSRYIINTDFKRIFIIDLNKLHSDPVITVTGRFKFIEEKSLISEVTPNNKYIIAIEKDRNLLIYDLDIKKKITIPGEFETWKIAPNSKYIVAQTSSNSIVIINLINPNNKLTAPGQILRITPDSNYMIIHDNDNIFIMDPLNLTIIKAIKCKDFKPYLAIEPYLVTNNSKYFIIASQKKIVIADLTNLNIKPKVIKGSFSKRFMLSSDNEHMITQEKKGINIIHLEKPNIKPIKIPGEFFNVQVSNGYFIAINKSQNLIIIDLKELSSNIPIPGKFYVPGKFYGQNMLITPDDKYIVALSTDGDLIIINLNNLPHYETFIGFKQLHIINKRIFAIDKDHRVLLIDPNNPSIVRGPNILNLDFICNHRFIIDTSNRTILSNLPVESANQLIKSIESLCPESLSFLNSDLNQNYEFYKSFFGKSLLNSILNTIELRKTLKINNAMQFYEEIKKSLNQIETNKLEILLKKLINSPLAQKDYKKINIIKSILIERTTADEPAAY